MVEIKTTGQADLYDTFLAGYKDDTEESTDAFDELCQIAINAGFDPDSVTHNPTSKEIIDYYILPYLANL